MDDHHQSKRKREEDDSDEDHILKFSDKSVLDCPICFHPLTIPVFQCTNGHITCSSCHDRLKPKCPTCSTNLGNVRNRAIEKVLESAIDSCSYKGFGCGAQLTYSTKRFHEKNCGYAPSVCPHKEGDKDASLEQLCTHFELQRRRLDQIQAALQRIIVQSRRV